MGVPRRESDLVAGQTPHPARFQRAVPRPQGAREGNASQASAAKGRSRSVFFSDFFLTSHYPPATSHRLCAASAQHKPRKCIWASLAAHRKRKACSWGLKKPRRLYASDTLGCFGARAGGSCSEVTSTSFAAPWLTSARLGSFARQVSQRGAAVLPDERGSGPTPRSPNSVRRVNASAQTSVPLDRHQSRQEHRGWGR